MSEKELTLGEIKRIFEDRKPGTIGPHERYSVLVPLVFQDGEPSVLFEIRSEELKRQPGEICFPGGKVEAGESEAACALRETTEELGLPAAAVQIIARLDDLHSYGNFTICSFLGVIDAEKLERAMISASEVKSIFLLPLSALLAAEPDVYRLDIIPKVEEGFPFDLVDGSYRTNWGKGRTEVPVYQLDGKVIWGLTARIARNFAKIIREHIREGREEK